ncbi:MAG: 6-bladed beta-propeller [Pseudomonadota bacterium]
MKGIVNFFIAAILVMVSAKSVYSGHSGYCGPKNVVPEVGCNTQLPLIYSDDFSSFNREYWFTEKQPVRIKGKGWIQFGHNTITSVDYVDQNLADFRINLRFRAWKWRSPEFTIQFTTGEELVFSYQKVKIQKRKRYITSKLFAATAWPEIGGGTIPLHFAGGRHTLTIEYNSSTGVVSLDTDNNCEFDHVVEWKPGLQFSHVTASNQKWDLFELYASSKPEMEEPSSGIPAYQLEWGGFGNGAKGLAVDAGNHVYVSSPSDNSVKKYDENGNLQAEWFDFSNPQGIAVDPDNFIYIADSGTSSIKKYNADGVLISELPRYGNGYESLSSVQDVAVDDAGVVYVSSFNIWFDNGVVFGSKIFKFTSDWVFIGEIIPGGNAIITGLDVDSQGGIYVTTTDGIRKYDPDGNFLMEIGTVSGGNDMGEFSRGSHDVHIGSSDLLFATDGNENNRIQVFNTDGEYLYEWGTTGSGNGEFMEPSRIAAGANGVFILDTGNNRVQKFK